MVRHLRGATVRGMIGRSPSTVLVSLLVLAQLLAGPLSHAAPLVDEGCGPNGQTSHTVSGMLTGCGDCPDEQSAPGTGLPGGDHHCRTHAACACRCAHTP